MLYVSLPEACHASNHDQTKGAVTEHRTYTRLRLTKSSPHQGQIIARLGYSKWALFWEVELIVEFIVLVTSATSQKQTVVNRCGETVDIHSLVPATNH